MALPVDICNWALLRLGQPRVNSIDPPFTDASGTSADCAFTYGAVRDSELRKHVWSFAKTRVSLAASGSGPVWGSETAYPLPPDFIRMIKKICVTRRIEGTNILSCEASPLLLEYVARVSPALFDPLFVEALSCKVALALAMSITTSANMKQIIQQDYDKAILEAKRVNAIEAPPGAEPEDSFITVRC